jgi:hypothetical protein
MRKLRKQESQRSSSLLENKMLQSIVIKKTTQLRGFFLLTTSKYYLNTCGAKQPFFKINLLKMGLIFLERHFTFLTNRRGEHDE